MVKTQAQLTAEVQAVIGSGLCCGTIWQHRRDGTMVVVEGIVHLEANAEVAVMYRHHTTRWVRSVADFREKFTAQGMVVG